MTDRELEARLRRFYRTEVGEDEAAPLALRRDVAVIPRTIPRPARWSGRNRNLTLLAAAALLLIGGAVAAGSGALRLPSVVPPVPAPTLPVAIASPTAGPTASPAPTETPAVIPPRAASWTATGSMVSPRTGQTATLLPDGRVLVTGGSDATGPLAAAELYDPNTGRWTSTGRMSTPRTGHTATLLPNGEVLVAGGEATVPKGLHEPPSLASAELYDPATGVWTATGTMSTSRSGQSATLLRDGKVLVTGGGGPGSAIAAGLPALASAELYDPATGSWITTGSMAASRSGQAATLLADGRVLVAGGATSVLNADGTIGGYDLASAEVYDPSQGSWSAAGSMFGTAGGLTTVLLPSGKVLHVGVPCDLFDPASGSWAATGNMRTPRGGEGVTLLSDGKVLVEGGAGGASVGIASAELYDPASGTWAATASPVMGSQGATATLLPDGRVLVAGGFGASGPLTSAELYTPGSGR